MLFNICKMFARGRHTTVNCIRDECERLLSALISTCSNLANSSYHSYNIKSSAF